VVTPAAMYDYTQDRRLRLIAVSVWTTVDDVLKECEHHPVIADQVATLDPPSDEELTIYRTELDVRGQTSDRGSWITWNGEKYEQMEDGA